MKQFYNNPDILEKIFKEHYPRIKAIAYWILENEEDAKDVASYCFAKFIEMDMDSIEMDNIHAFLNTMARNRAIDYLRKEKKKQQYLDSNEAKEVQSLETRWACEQVVAESFEKRMEKIKELSHSLPPRQKEVFYCRFFEKKTAQETCVLLNIKITTVNNTYADAKENLKNMIKAGGTKNE